MEKGENREISNGLDMDGWLEEGNQFQQNIQLHTRHKRLC
jgi:hypothetical protein